MELATRRVCFAGLTVHPDEEWMLQIARNLTDAEAGFLRGKKYLLMDRDDKFSEAFRVMLEQGGVEAVRLPPRSPNLAAHIERFMRSVKEECLERIIFFGERSLQNAVSSYMVHYHAEREIIKGSAIGSSNRATKWAALPARAHAMSDSAVRCGIIIAGQPDCFYA